MIKYKFEIDIFHFLNQIKEQSKCIDKQVVCAITDDNCNILSYGINEIIECDQNCDNKENRKCKTIHAEIIAIGNLSTLCKGPFYAYLNLFPCVPCQKKLKEIVKEIIVFGPKHKEQIFDSIRLENNLYTNLLKNNGEAKQLSVAQGELCELVTMISDYFYRTDKNIKMSEMLDEIIDTELMLNQIKLICWKKNHDIYNMLRELRRDKYDILSHKLEKNML